MNLFVIAIFMLIHLSTSLLANIIFSSDSLTLEFPSTIIASGNSTFKNDLLHISSKQFSYNTTTQSGQFNSDVVVTYKNSKLQGNHFYLLINDRSIIGKGNITFNAEDLTAYSDDLIISNYEVLTLKNNVRVQRNGSQIKTNELVYNLKTDTILSNERVKLTIED